MPSGRSYQRDLMAPDGAYTWLQKKVFVALRMGLQDIPVDMRRCYAELKLRGGTTMDAIAVQQRIADHLTMAVLQSVAISERADVPVGHSARCNARDPEPIEEALTRTFFNPRSSV